MLDKVRIGIYEYAVIESSEPIILDKVLCKGLIDYDNLTITIKKDMPEEKKHQTLWHEIMHGIVRDWGVNLDGDNEESKIDWIATGMCQVIKDNPNLFKEEHNAKENNSTKNESINDGDGNR